MKEISEVIEEYDIKQKAEELGKSYSNYMFRIKVLLKNDLCKIEEIDNLDDYTKVEEYVIPLVTEKKYYHLYIKNKTNEFYYISKNSLYSQGFAGSIIKTDHINNIDADAVLNIALEAEKLNVQKVHNFSELLFFTAALAAIFAIFVFFLTIEEGLYGLLFTALLLVIALILIALGMILNNLHVIYDKISKMEEK